VTTAQINADHFHNFSDLARYSPSVSRSTASNFSTFSKIRGSPSDTTRNGILLLPAAVRPFNNNYWEAVDIVAGVPSVIQGSTTRTSGIVNYVTKKPTFDRTKTDLTFHIGRLGLDSDRTYPQYTVQLDHNIVVDAEKFAVRFSLQRTNADQYWGNSASDFYDLYAASTWKPRKNITVETNWSYGTFAGAMPYGINRIDQNLLDNWLYRSGSYVPRINLVSGDYTKVDGTVVNFPGGDFILPQGGGTAQYLYADRSRPGWFGTAKNGPYDISADALAFSKDAPVAVSLQAPDSYTLVPIKGSQTIYSNRAFSDTTEQIIQNVTNLRINEHFTLRNNTLYHYVNSYVYGSDGYHSYMTNKMFTSRFEFTTDFEVGKAKSWLRKLGVRHQSNTGYEFRFLYNLCDNVGSLSNYGWGAQQDATNPADGGGQLGYGPTLGTADILASLPFVPYSDYLIQLTASGGQQLARPKVPVQTGQGYWILINPTFHQGDGRHGGIVPYDTMLRINELYQNNLFTEQKLAVWKFILRAGGRLTYINDFIRSTRPTYDAIANGLLPGYTNEHFNDHASENNYDINGSISFQPFSRLTLYAAWDRSFASEDCACCLTMGFSQNNYLRPDRHNYGLNAPSGFKRKSSLREFGAKYEIISGKLFGSFAYFHQLRYNTLSASEQYPSGGIGSATLYEGYETALTWQPDARVAAGVNFSEINAAAASGGPQAAAVPKHSGNIWGSWQFAKGFGAKGSVWATSPWRVSTAATVRSQHNLDLGLFYDSKAWRVDLDIQNVTGEKNWAPGGNYSGDSTSALLPAERLGLIAKITRHF
jgi:hypothetical protein